MLPISRHIESLLLRHDCVIVPGLGGFITNHIEAQADTTDNEFVMYPPCRVVRFNQALQSNDGLLAASYMSVYDVAYPAAEKQMMQDVYAVVDKLKKNGRYTFDGIGTLHLDLAGNMTLETAESGLTTPAFYGLARLEMRSADAVEAAAQLQEAIQQTTIVPVVPAPDEDTSDDSAITVRIRRRWVDIAISAAAAVLLFFFISYPMFSDSTQDEVVVSTIARTNSAKQKPAQAPAPQTTAEETLAKDEARSNDNQAELAEADIAVEGESEEQALKSQVADNEETAQPQAKGSFTIVLASYVAERNSLEFVERLAKAGLDEGRYEVAGHVSHVFYSRYESREAANKALTELRQQSSEFSEAWIYEYK